MQPRNTSIYLNLLLPERSDREPSAWTLCPICEGSYFWISKLDKKARCMRCHPPATNEIVSCEIGEPPKNTELLNIEKARLVEYQRDACRWCNRKILNCPDCKGGRRDR